MRLPRTSVANPLPRRTLRFTIPGGRAAGKPYIESEATPGNAPGGYWGTYSKKDGYYNYINIGIYTEAMKAEQIRQTVAHLSKGEGYMLASTWLQCIAPYGPNHHPGGDGGQEDPGIKWWLAFLRNKYGAYMPLEPRRKAE